MKLGILLLVASFSVSAFAVSQAFTLDPAGPVQFTAASANCSLGEVVVQRRFRSETRAIAADLCGEVSNNPRQYNQLGFGPNGEVIAVGYATNTGEQYIVSTL